MTDAEIIEVLKQHPNAGDISKFIDRQVSKAINTYVENHAGPADLEERLAAIDEALENKDSQIAKLELDSHIFKKCTETGVAYDLVSDISFTDAEAAYAKITQLATAIVVSEREKLNIAMANGFKPGSGTRSDDRDLKNLSMAEAVFLEESGQLD